MRNNKFLLIVVFLLLVVSMPAFAKNQDQTGPPTADDWFVSQGDWWTTHSEGGGFSSTDCALLGGCWACLQNQYGKLECSYGVQTGRCNCENVPKEGAAPGITYCRLAYGTCRVRAS